MDQPIPLQRQGGRRVTARAGRQGANSAPETASSIKLQAGFQLLTNSSWDSGRLTSTRKVAARDQLPRRDTHGILEMGTPRATQESKRLGPRR